MGKNLHEEKPEPVLMTDKTRKQINTLAEQKLLVSKGIHCELICLNSKFSELINQLKKINENMEKMPNVR